MQYTHRIKLALALFAAVAICGQAGAQSQVPSGNPPAARPAPSPVMQELRAIMTSVQTKIKEKGGTLTEADVADDIKAFNDLLAKHAGEKTDEIAQIAMMKAALYTQVLKDSKKGDELMAQVKKDYKDTQFIQRLEKQEAAQAEAKKLQAALAPGLPFPDFNEKDIEGKELSVGNYKGKVVLIDFWATWCGPCVKELPNVIETYKKHHGDGFEIIGISLDNTRANLDAFLKKNEGMTWPQYFDGKGWQNKLAGKYGVNSIPFTVLVGKDGKIIKTNLRGAALETAVAEALK